MRLFINALAASAGGGLTYIRNVLPHLSGRSDVTVSVALRSDLRQEFRSFRDIEFLETDGSVGRRFWYEQSVLPRMIRSCQADVLLSAGNFAIRRSPVPQILLSRNSIYLSTHYYRDLFSRGEYRVWLETRFRGVLAKKSIHWADVTVAPSDAFALDLARWSGRRVLGIHHGFDFDEFCRDESPFSESVREKLRSVEGSLKILFVSHYNYYRNFETLIRALPLVRERLSNRQVKLILTCELGPGKNPGAYRTERVSKLVRDLGIAESIVELGAVPYRQLHQLYRQADLYVSPAYIETFAHPLVEAMAMGVPVIASDLAVHREICEDAAAYFPRFSPEALTQAVEEVASSPEMAQRMSDAGRKRAKTFSWKSHVEKILEVCDGLLNPAVRRAANGNMRAVRLKQTNKLTGMTAIQEEIWELLACPRDKLKLHREAERLRCEQGHSYPIVDGVPILLLSEVEQTHIEGMRALAIAETGDASLLPMYKLGPNDIDPFVRNVIGATNGSLYQHLVGNLTEYPIPVLRLPPGDGRLFLEVGCNWGRWCIAAQRQGYRPIGIDPSLKSIRAANRVTRQLGIEANFLVADGRFLPFREESFDQVFSYSVLQHLSRENVAIALAEIHRVLRPSARALVQMPNVFGIRCLYHQARRGFREGQDFDVRYWKPSELLSLFEKKIGPSALSVDGYFSLNVQPSDVRLLPARYRAIVQTSEVLRKISHVVPLLARVADSLYVDAVREN